jgi:hypothetical protein
MSVDSVCRCISRKQTKQAITQEDLMSAVPPSFTPVTSFSTLAQQPITTTGLPGSELDGEFSRASDSINQIKSRLSEIQRDDGKIRNGVVTTEALSGDVKSLFISSGANPITWSAGIEIKVGDLVSNPPSSPGTYLCIIAHTSSNLFTSDLNKWALIAAPPVVGVLFTNTFTGNGSSTVFTLTQVPASKDNTQLFIDGIYQPKSGYSVNGSFLTIEPAPAAGSDIEVSIGVPTETTLVTVEDGAIGAAKIADGAVVASKIGASAVINSKIGANAVTTAKIADNSITSTKIADRSVTNLKIGQGAVGFLEIADNAVTGSKISPSTITSTNLEDLAVTTSKLMIQAVNSGKIADLAVLEQHLKDANVTARKIANGAITEAKIGSSAVTTTKLGNGQITAGKLNGNQTGSAPIYAARAWVLFDGTKNAAGNPSTANTERLIRQSGNVSSVVRTAAGEYTVNFAEDLASMNSAVSVGSDSNTPAKLGGVIDQNASWVKIKFCQINTSSTGVDPERGSVVVFR